MKMMAIGLGKQHGAESIHHQSPGIMHELVEEYGLTILQNCPILGGIAIIENAYDQTYLIKGLTADEIITEEPKLRDLSYQTIAHLLFDKCDVLVVDKIGKNISGDGMDPNISGRFVQPKYCSGGIEAEKCVILDLTDETHGNAQGVGLAEVTTRRLFNKMKLEMTYPTGVTNTFLHLMKIPMIMDNDREALQLALCCCPDAEDQNNIKMIRIRTPCTSSISRSRRGCCRRRRQIQTLRSSQSHTTCPLTKRATCSENSRDDPSAVGERPGCPRYFDKAKEKGFA